MLRNPVNEIRHQIRYRDHRQSETRSTYWSFLLVIHLNVLAKISHAKRFSLAPGRKAMNLKRVISLALLLAPLSALGQTPTKDATQSLSPVSVRSGSNSSQHSNRPTSHSNTTSINAIDKVNISCYHVLWLERPFSTRQNLTRLNRPANFRTRTPVTHSPHYTCALPFFINLHLLQNKPLPHSLEK